MRFLDREDAARQLIPHLEKYKTDDVILFAIPRGGVVLGDEIAFHFGWELHILLTKKIGHPMNHEYAIGAISQEGEMLLHHHPEVPESYIDYEKTRLKKLLDKQYQKFMGDRKPPEVRDKVVILVDDGIATGFTMKTSIALIRKKMPAKIVVAVPVASPRILKSFRELTDEFIVVSTPDDFMGVGQFYESFTEVTDEKVMEIMRKYR